MTTPASRILSAPSMRLYDSGEVDYVALDGTHSRVTMAAALVAITRGTVEGVGPGSGRILYLREIAAPLVPMDMQPAGKDRSSGRLPIAESDIYRQEVEASQMDEWGMPTRVVIGHVYAFRSLRRVGI